MESANLRPAASTPAPAGPTASEQALVMLDASDPPILEAAPPPAMFVERAELEDLWASLEGVAVGQNKRPVIVVTGSLGSGKSTLLAEAARRADRRGLTTVAVDLASSPAASSARQVVAVILRLIASAIGLGEAREGAASGVGDLRSLGQEIARTLEKVPAPRPVLITLDNADAGGPVPECLRLLEEHLLARLHVSGSGARMLVVVTSKRDLEWYYILDALRTIRLQPFDAQQIALQIKGTRDQAERLLRVTGGLPGATALLAESRGLDQLNERRVFHEIFAQFVEPLLASDPRRAAAAKAAALLPGGFDVSQLASALPRVSITRDFYAEESLVYYLWELDRLHQLGLVFFNEVDGRYHLEAHLAPLLLRWHQWENGARDADSALLAGMHSELADESEIDAATTIESSASVSSSSDQQSAAVTSRRPALVGSLEKVFQAIQQATRKEVAGRARRRDVLLQLARYLCRMPGYQADIIFLIGQPGSGKTELLHDFRNLVQEALGIGRGPQPSPLLVLGKDTDWEAATAPLYASLGSSTPDYSGTRGGLLDLETSMASRVGTVKKALQVRLVDALVTEELHDGADKETLADARRRIMRQYFGDYQRIHDEWQQLRRSLPPLPEADRQRMVAVEIERTRRLGKELDDAFFQACRRIAEVPDNPGVRRRILITLDTYDYPSRSGIATTQMFADVTARLAGDYCFIVACRPPIAAEYEDLHLHGDLRRYLPDDLQDQAVCIYLDKSAGAPAEALRCPLSRQEATSYYEGRPWFKATTSPARDELRAVLGRILVAHDNLPVVLGLLEFYAGLNDRTGQEASELDLRRAVADLHALDQEPATFAARVLDGVVRHGRIAGDLQNPVS